MLRGSLAPHPALATSRSDPPENYDLTQHPVPGACEKRPGLNPANRGLTNRRRSGRQVLPSVNHPVSFW
jgi:hypothetical protein